MPVDRISHLYPFVGWGIPQTQMCPWWVGHWHCPITRGYRRSNPQTQLQARSSAACIDVTQQICQQDLNTLLWKHLWQKPRQLPSGNASPHISTSWLVGNISGEEVKKPISPQALMTSRDCWHIHFDSWMWQSPLQEKKLPEREHAVERLTESTSLTSYHFRKLNNLPCKQKSTATAYSAETALQRHKKPTTNQYDTTW